jgi:hypothetical protein
MALNRDPNIADPDAFYAALIDAQRDLTDAECVAFNARLILLLANHVGDMAVLREAIAAARTSIGREA